MSLNVGNAPQRKQRRIWSTIVIGALVAVMAVAVVLLISLVAAPGAAKKFIGETITHAEKGAADSGVSADPVVQLGAPGGQAEVDQCSGVWTEMTEYSDPKIGLPVYAAHNGCGGNPVLALASSDTIMVQQLDGTQSLYRVASEKVIPQHTSTTSDLYGLSGELLLQTCFWDDTTMRIVGLVPVAPSAMS